MKFRLTRYPSNENPFPILTPRPDVDWEGVAVFNPSVIKDGEKFIMLYRTYPKGTVELGSKPFRPGKYLANQKSNIGYAQSVDGINFERRDTPLIAPSESYDMFGCEDPRVTKIDDTFYITYTAIDSPLDDSSKKPNVRIALATTKDFVTITKHGIIGPSKQSKAAAFFPSTINGKVALVMTVSSDTTKSHIVIRYFNTFDELLEKSVEGWQKFLEISEANAVLKTYNWLHRGPELGAVPILTDKGWLLIFSAESMSDTWTVSAALLDKDDPTKLVARATGYLLQPATDYERNGLVPYVTFPEGAVIVGDELYVYYGCADSVIGLATCKLHELLDYLERCRDL
jgi:predicted GH43/DUF377 family glycosyl hydrolase